jgi:hypothetical protein
MATNPAALLSAAGIFGNGPNMSDPRVRALFGLPPLAVGGPAPAPVFAPQAPQPQLPQAPNAMVPFAAAAAGGLPSALGYLATNPTPFVNGPQDPNEQNLTYALRHAIGAPVRAVQGATADVSKFFNEATDTPAAAAARAKATTANSPFPSSFGDPAYDHYEAAVAQSYGNPTLADGLARLRQLGERSNAGAVSSAGAKTPYQITPSTRSAIMKQFGFDPWSSPQNAARGAAIAATTYVGKDANFNDPQIMARAAGGYFAGAKGAANPFGTASDGNNTTGQYVQRVLGPNTPLAAPFDNPYNPAYDRAALGAIGDERKALMTPFTATANVGPAPQLPAPEAVPQTDFSQSDQAMQAMKPIEMSEKERLQMQRTGFFKGIGQAMMQSPGSEGIGTLLMRIGGGALAGRAAADDQIHAETSKFDDEMAKYNAAVYQNDLMKADVHAREAQQTVANNNQYNMDNWKVAYDRWSKNGNIDISGTNAIISQTDGNTGIKTVRVLPVTGAVNAAIAQQRAQVFQHMGGMDLQGNSQVTSMNNAIVGRQAIMSMMSKGGTQEADAGAVAAPAFYGTFIASHGLLGDLLGADGAKSLEQSTQKQLQSQQLMPGSQEWAQRHDQIIATEITKLGLANPAIMHKMIQVGGSANSFQALSALQKARTSTSTDSKGMPTTRSSSPAFQGNAADLFSVDQGQ